MFRAQRLAVALLTFLVAAFLSPAHAQRTLRIAAAADLEPVLPALFAPFEQQHGVKISAAYASSATLAAQIINGGPFDLFLAADLSFPERVVAAGLADSPKPVIYARGTLVLWTRKDSHLGMLNMDRLRDPEISTVAVANPEHAPYGRAARAAIESLGLAATVASKLVVAENIAQAAQYADSGNAQLGFLSLTSARTPRLQADGHYIEVPRSSYPAILQGAVVLKNSPHRALAHQFLAYLLSAPVSQQLAAHGLQAP